jgi:hypothetical protein
MDNVTWIHTVLQWTTTTSSQRPYDELILPDYIDISITKMEIMDKSKGDGLLKGLVIL